MSFVRTLKLVLAGLAFAIFVGSRKVNKEKVISQKYESDEWSTPQSIVSKTKRASYKKQQPFKSVAQARNNVFVLRHQHMTYIQSTHHSGQTSPTISSTIKEF